MNFKVRGVAMIATEGRSPSATVATRGERRLALDELSDAKR